MDYSFLVGIHQNYIPKSINFNKQPNKHISFFKKDDGGLYSIETGELYFFTIIDIFTEWTVKKRMENSIKSLVYESTGISAIPPHLYRERFLKFMSEITE